MKKSLKLLFVSLISLLLCSTMVFAGTPVASGDATMKLVEDNLCEIKFGESGEFTKKMTAIDTQNKTIDITLTAKNNAKPAEGDTKVPGEVVLLIDNSNSMATNSVTVNGKTTTRKDLVLEAANELVSKLYKADSSFKVGVVEFATSTDESKKGTAEDAKIVTSSLVSSENDAKAALTTIKNEKMGAQTNIVAGLDAANKLLSTSTDSKKFIVLLTDAIPNTAYGVTYDLYTSASADPTKAKLKEIANKNVNILSMLIHMTEDEIQISKEDPKPTYLEKANSIFGTTTAPTAGSVYYADDKDVTTTVTNTIYDELITKANTSANSLTNIVIKDYFPDYIINNFDYAQLTQPDKGNVTATVNKEDNSITWTISQLNPGESSNFTYRLKLKNTFDSDIVAKNLSTNKDVTIDYEQNGKKQPQVHNDKCPIVILDVTATKKIPQTGSNTWFIIGSITTTALTIGIVSFISSKKRIK